MQSISENTTEIVTDGHLAGVVRGNVLDIRKHSFHFVKKFKGYGIHPDTIEQAEKAGANCLRLSVIETGEVYECSFAELRQYAIPANLGAGFQLFFPVNYFKWIKAHRSQRNQPLQISLFQ